MTYRIYRDNRYDDLLYVHLIDTIEWTEYDHIIDEMIATIQTIQGDIYVIVLGDSPQPKGNPMPHFRRTIHKINTLPNLQLAITVDNGIHSFLRMCLEVMVKIYSPNWNNKLPFVATLNEAKHLIEEHRTQKQNA